jgi:hypothetical protein
MSAIGSFLKNVYTLLESGGKNRPGAIRTLLLDVDTTLPLPSKALMTIVSPREVDTFNPPAEENTTLLVVVTTVDPGIPVDTVVCRDDASMGLVHV